MSRKKRLPPGFYDEPFLQLFKKSTRKRESLRYSGLHHLQQGCTHEEVSQQIGTSIDAIFRWVGRYRNKGIEGLKEGRRSGRPGLIDKEQQEQLNKNKPATHQGLPINRKTNLDLDGIAALIPSQHHKNCTLVGYV